MLNHTIKISIKITFLLPLMGYTFRQVEVWVFVFLWIAN